jgi:CheY-like chemotaxis protein
MKAALKILIVDDNAELRAACSTILVAAGYEVATAEDGFSGLLSLARDVPDLILCDLHLPRMSGFEFLSVVRRRFPEVRVVALSDAYLEDSNPGGLLADAFHSKGQGATTFLGTITTLLQSSTPSRSSRELAEVWIPMNAKDTNGQPYVVATCTDCFRTFPLAVPPEGSPEVLTAYCFFCSHEVRYKNDFSRLTTSTQEATDAKPSSESEAVAV